MLFWNKRKTNRPSIMDESPDNCDKQSALRIFQTVDLGRPASAQLKGVPKILPPQRQGFAA